MEFSKSKIFETIIDFFKKESIPFCVLRNYEEYPQKIKGDIDVLILPEFIGKIDKILKETADSYNIGIWNYCGGKNESRAPRTFFWTDKNKNINTLHFDFFYCLEEFGAEYLNQYRVVDQRRPFKNFFILDKQSEFMHIIMHGIFWSHDRDHKIRYENKIRGFLKEKRNIPESLIRSVFPFFIANEIINNLKNIRISKIFLKKRIKKYCLLFKNHLFFKKTFYYIRKKLNYTVNVFSPTGEFVVILGPDGVGKSTTAEIIHKLFQAFEIPSRHVHLGFRPAFLPTRQKLGMDKSGIGGFSEEVTDNHDLSKTTLKDTLRYFYHFLDYVLAYFFRIRPILVRGETVIAERYFYDYVIHLSRKKMAVNKKLVEWTFRFLMPKPSACILLFNTHEEILRRRQELTREEITDFMEKGEILGKMAKRFIKAKTDISPDDLAVRLAKWLACSGANK
jgi:thymidylate kinase